MFRQPPRFLQRKMRPAMREPAIAIVLARPPGVTFASGQTRAGLGAPDLDLARSQHAAYVAALERAGARAVLLPPDPEHPDSTFVEDCAVIVRSDAVLTRPGHPARRGEVAAIRGALQPLTRAIDTVEEPGTVDGGDVLEAGERFLIGLSERTNEEGARQLAAHLETRGRRADIVDIRGLPGLLHLKTGIAYVGDGAAVAVDSLAHAARSIGLEPLLVDEGESYGANCILVNGRLLIPSGCPVLERRLRERGRQVEALDMSEFRKMDGGLSCLSLRLPADGGG